MLDKETIKVNFEKLSLDMKVKEVVKIKEEEIKNEKIIEEERNNEKLMEEKIKEEKKIQSSLMEFMSSG